jgi:hypothetical protein
MTLTFTREEVKTEWFYTPNITSRNDVEILAKTLRSVSGSNRIVA